DPVGQPERDEIGIGGDVAAVDLDVVAGVGDHGQLRADHVEQSARELRAARAPLRAALGRASRRGSRRRAGPRGRSSRAGYIPGMVLIREVGPRDGFQNEPEVIPTAEKIRLIDLLARTGIPRLEVTSFVRADVIPQLADAAEVLAGIDVPD